MAIRIYKFKDALEAQHFLNGGVVGGKADRVSGIVGRTLILDGVTTTFTAVGGGVAGDSTALYFKDIRDQINTATSNGYVVSLLDGKIAILEATINNGIVVGAGTGNELLGFKAGANPSSKVYAALAGTPAAPSFLQAMIGSDNSHIVYVLE